MQHELKQVEVRLKLTDKAGVFSMQNEFNNTLLFLHRGEYN